MTLTAEATQGCVLVPLLYTQHTNDPSSRSEPVHIFRYADDATV